MSDTSPTALELLEQVERTPIEDDPRVRAYAARMVARAFGLWISGLQLYWGLALAWWVRASSTPSFDVMELVADFDAQGLTVAALSLPVGWGHWRGGWPGVAASVVTVCVWAYVFAAFAAANPHTTALPTYSWIWGLGVVLIVMTGRQAPPLGRS